MNERAVVSLIKDLTAKLSAVAEEFSGRLDQVDADRPAGPPAADAASDDGGPGNPAPDNLTMVKRLIAERRSRRRFLPAELFHEPAWDMLLALYVAHEESQAMNVKSLVACADAPVTTSQRWIEHLAKLRLVTRVVDSVDRRRVEVSLSQNGIEAIEAYLAAHR